MDPDFNWISKSPKFWQKKIDAFYEKYKGIKEQHDRWMREAISTGKLVMPQGREYPFQPYEKHGELQWPRTQIINYPVQGTGADIITVARVSFRRRLNELPSSVRDGILLVSTVHDSIVVDCEPALLEYPQRILGDVFDDLPSNLRAIFGIDFNLPLKVEIKVGHNLLDMNEV